MRRMNSVAGTDGLNKIDSITEEDAVRILTAFCSTYPDLLPNYTKADARYTEAVQGVRVDNQEDSSPRPTVRDMPQGAP